MNGRKETTFYGDLGIQKSISYNMNTEDKIAFGDFIVYLCYSFTVCGRIRTVIGQAQLLIDQRFKQFNELITLHQV